MLKVPQFIELDDADTGARHVLNIYFIERMEYHSVGQTYVYISGGRMHVKQSVFQILAEILKALKGIPYE